MNVCTCGEGDPFFIFAKSLVKTCCLSIHFQQFCVFYDFLLYLQVNVPTFDFIDLPGIQTLPEVDRLQTEGLVNSYICDSNTLVLCVLEATDAALDKGFALKALIDAGKLGSTIIALTKSDKVHEDDFEDHVFKRLLLKSETSPVQLEGLKGCVAVVNRRHQDSDLTLEQAAEKELTVFAKMLNEAQGEFKTPAMQRQLGAAMTSKQLMVMLNKMYHAHITGEWVNATLATISAEQSKVRKSLEQLGEAPETLSKADVLIALYSKVSLPAYLSMFAYLSVRPSACLHVFIYTTCLPPSN